MPDNQFSHLCSSLRALDTAGYDVALFVHSEIFFSGFFLFCQIKVTEEKARSLAKTFFRREVLSISRLDGYDDVNYKIVTQDGETFTLKVGINSIFHCFWVHFTVFLLLFFIFGSVFLGGSVFSI